MTFETQKSDCSNAIIFGLNRTSHWRGKMAVRHPSDPRNARGQECLAALAADATQLTDADWIRLQPYAGWASESFREAISLAARQVGFTRKVQDFPSFVNHLLDVLSEQSVAA